MKNFNLKYSFPKIALSSVSKLVRIKDEKNFLTL